MGRTLSLVVIVTMMSTARTQKVFDDSQAGYPMTNAFQNQRSGELQYSIPPIFDNLSTRYPEIFARTNKVIRPEGPKVLNRLQINKRGALEDSVSDSDRVVFPGPTSHSRPIVLDIPENCQRQGYCENVPNHPVDLVERAIERLGEKVKLLQRDSIPVDENVAIVQRLGGVDAEIPLCTSTSTILHPESAQDKDGTWFTVLNLKDKPIQGFLAEVCDFSQSKQCSPLVSFPKGYTSSCIQKHVYRVMEALDSSGKQVQVPLKLPSCCSCVLNKVD